MLLEKIKIKNKKKELSKGLDFLSLHPVTKLHNYFFIGNHPSISILNIAT